MEKMREEFEAWKANDTGAPVSVIVSRRELDGYSYDRLNREWIAWQASRSAQCVELPDVDGDKDFYMDQFSNDGWCGYGQAIDSVRAILDEAGVRYT